MGLDTYATQRGAGGRWKVAPDEPFDGIELCGGICSGGQDSSSIRGKVYDHVVRAATGESLYQERITPETVAEMARLLRAAVEEAQRTGTSSGAREVAEVDEQGRLELDEHGRLRMETQEIAVLDVAGQELPAGEAENLARWFEVCADHGYAVEGWW
jgi:hypothetical protein